MTPASVEGELDHLGVAGLARADVLVAGVCRLPPHVAGLTDSTPLRSSNTASRHQKQPPARVAISFPASVMSFAFRYG